MNGKTVIQLQCNLKWAPSPAYDFGRKPLTSTFYRNAGELMRESDRFVRFMRDVVAPALFIVVTVAFCVGSFWTTAQGFRSIFSLVFSGLLALGLQSGMLGASIFFAHNKAPQRRLAWLCAGLFACALSICFSYVGLRFDYAKSVFVTERPMRDRADFMAQRSRLQEVGAEERGAALRALNQQITDSDSRRGLAELSRTARELQAAKYRQDISQLMQEIHELTPSQRDGEEGPLQDRLHRTETLLAVAQGSTEILSLESLKQRSSAQQLRKLRDEVAAYAPDFQGVKDNDGTGHPDWTGLDQRYDRFARLMQEVPGDAFQTELHRALPALPSAKVLSADNQVFEGEGHPINSAFQHLARLQPVDVFLFALAVSFDLIPLWFNWALGDRRSGERSLPESLSAIGAWQRRARSAIRSMDGLVPFSARSLWSVLFGRAEKTGHDSVAEFEDRLVQEQLAMSRKLQELVLPESLRELISLEFDYVHSQVIAIASTRAAQFETLAWNAYERCLAAIRGATGLDEKTRTELTAFLDEQVRILSATAAKYSTEEEILTEMACDEGKDGDAVQENENDNSQKQPEASQSGDASLISMVDSPSVARRDHVAYSKSGRPARQRRKASTNGTHS